MASISQTAGILNFRFRKGDSFSFVATFDVDGTPIDLTGATYRMQIRTTAGALILDCGPMWATEGDPTLGTAKLTIPAADSGTIALPPGCTGTVPYPYDMEVVAADATVFTWLTGLAQIDPEISVP